MHAYSLHAYWAANGETPFGSKTSAGPIANLLTTARSYVPTGITAAALYVAAISYALYTARTLCQLLHTVGLHFNQTRL